MQQNPPPPFQIPEMPFAAAAAGGGDATTSTLSDWSEFLDYNLDEHVSISFHNPEQQQFNQFNQPGDQSQQAPDSPGRVRKRDPRLVCSNFLAGIVPCACPELDAMLAEMEAVLPGKKRPRKAKIVDPARCQVAGCEADISELKGYHKRHKVCLVCANSNEVVIDGERKRYCQQCGRFHILSDFDEGKRSCRRKLARHNYRRRRKANDSKEGMGKDPQHIVLADDVSGDDNTGKDGIRVSRQIEEIERLLESDGDVATLCSAQKSDSIVSFTASDETHIDMEKQNPIYKHSPSYCDDKSAFSSMCPAGRISFKLYDWNPADFPRGLRHQIFQWLASMPVELEGYIRPGCTILTAFIAMPRPMWFKLLEEPALCVKDLVASPRSMLSGRGTMLVYLNDMIFRVTKDATSVVKVKVNNRAPKIHYIYPTCFEAGRPMEFVACGSDLLQPNFRFLVSFAGRYQAYNICVSSECCEEGNVKNVDHQLLKIYVPQTDMDLFGPAFIEVENQFGLSNFIPILIGDRDTCAEMEMLPQKFDLPLSSQEQKLSSCEVFSLKQAQFSEFLLDVAWLLKKPRSEQKLTSSHIQRFNYLLNCLMEKESYVILERVFCSMKSEIVNNSVSGISDIDMRLLSKNMDIAQSRLARKLLEKDSTDVNFYSHSSENSDQSVRPSTNQGFPRMLKNMLGLNVPTQSLDEGARVPLLEGDVIMTVNLQDNSGKSCSRLLTRTFFSPRTLIISISAVCVCFGLCAVVLHPRGVDQIAITIRRCLATLDDNQTFCY